MILYKGHCGASDILSMFVVVAMLKAMLKLNSFVKSLQITHLKSLLLMTTSNLNKAEKTKQC